MAGQTSHSIDLLRLQLLLRECGLLQRLAGLRRHFCMAAGDAALFFMDSAEEELGKKADALSVPYLQQLLDLGEALLADPSALHWY